MDKNPKLATLALAFSFVLAACDGGGSEVAPPPPPPPPPPAGITEAQRIAAAQATAASNAKCSAATLGPYYWEIGDGSGVKVSGSVGTGAPTATTSMWVYSASKWLYAANVVQKRGVQATDIPFLNFTSGYADFGNAPICVGGDSVTVAQCLIARDSLVPSTVGRFAYDSGHMQYHAAHIMNLGPDVNADLAADLNATIGNLGFSYSVPQLAAGVNISPQGYGTFLRRLLRGELALASALGSHKVCAQAAAPGCNAAYTPDSIGNNEAWNYSLGHWVEDDPVVGDHAFSSGGGGGFYPWIDSSKSYYGIVGRERTEAGAGYHSAECGRLLRQAWRTGVTVTADKPTP